MKNESTVRSKVTILGAVQGVGFRPFVYRLAKELNLTGFVSNSSHGVLLEVEGNSSQIDHFLNRLPREIPPLAFIQSLESSLLDPAGYTSFRIRASLDGEATALVLPDIASCPDCLAEVFNPRDRRYRYPFTNCTNCGPRFSIINSLPYDRPNTTMKNFQMCGKCLQEYRDPMNRRFHAQPNACPECGPHVELWDQAGRLLAGKNDALFQCAEAIREGQVVAVKGLGGFHLMAAADRDFAVRTLRRRKQREEKPLALMYPDIEAIRHHCRVSAPEERLLLSPEAPIILLERLEPFELEAGTLRISEFVAPSNPYFGVMLPYTPLHHILLKELGSPVVATSGNLSDEPICTRRPDALNRLSAIADLFLVHDRPIARHVDDSIVRVMAGREMVLRRARGYAPLPLTLNRTLPPLLAVGGHLKNSVALTVGSNVFVSQHIGDLDTVEADRAFKGVIESLQGLYRTEPAHIAADLHPDYRSTQYARHSGKTVTGVQHHYAHVLACMAENEVTGPVLGVSWDGTGYGTDGTIWGGEFMRVTEEGFSRVGHFRTFPLPGGEKAIQQPCRTALGLLFEMLGEDLWKREDLSPLNSFSAEQLRILQSMLSRKLNCPLTSSAGRLFDAAASLIDLRQKTRFEGQAAMELEFLISSQNTGDTYPFEISPATNAQDSSFIVDWQPLFTAILKEKLAGARMGDIARRFHNTLGEVIVGAARHANEEAVVLSGGCFQNKYLTELTILRLRQEGFRPYWHQRIPPNDGGICLGQILAVASEIEGD